MATIIGILILAYITQLVYWFMQLYEDEFDNKLEALFCFFPLIWPGVVFVRFIFNSIIKFIDLPFKE